MLNLVAWIIFGALVGWLASIVMGVNARQGCLMNVVVGVVGAFLGGIIISLLLPGGVDVNPNIFDPISLVVALIGAIVLLLIVGAVRGSPRTR